MYTHDTPVAEKATILCKYTSVHNLLFVTTLMQVTCEDDGDDYVDHDEGRDATTQNGKE